MSTPGLSSGALSMSQSQAQWDAIAAIKSTSPFAETPTSTGASISAALDAMLPGYGTAAAAGVTAAAGGDASAQIAEQIRTAQQSTIDLFA